MMCNTLREQLSTKRTKFSHLQFYFFFHLAEFMLKSMCLFQPFWDIVQHIIYTELLQWLIVINYHPEFFASQAGLQAIFAFLSNQELMLQSVLLIVLHSCNNILKKMFICFRTLKFSQKCRKQFKKIENTGLPQLFVCLGAKNSHFAVILLLYGFKTQLKVGCKFEQNFYCIRYLGPQSHCLWIHSIDSFQAILQRCSLVYC